MSPIRRARAAGDGGDAAPTRRALGTRSTEPGPTGTRSTEPGRVARGNTGPRNTGPRRARPLRPRPLDARHRGARGTGVRTPLRALAPFRALAVLLAALVLVGGAAGSAGAAGYRYWSFWERTDGTWTYATVGPAASVPDDGDVQGFRFSVSEDSGDAAKPRGTADFAAICADTPAEKDRKRVGLVIDFGELEDAPDGETPPAARTVCAVLDEDATTAEALASVAKPLRYGPSALLCAIAGYPRTGCGEQVAGKDTASGRTGAAEGGARSGTDPAAADGAGDDGGFGPSAGLLAGIAAVAALGAAAVWQARRRGNGH